MRKNLSILLMVLFISSSVYAQVSEEEAQKANNPLANVKAVNLHNYYTSSFYDGGESRANAMLLRYAQPFADGKILMRATLPLVTNPSGVNPNNYSSGLGDLNFFATYVFSRPGARTLMGVGPQVVLPTATSTHTGAGKWQLGAAFVAFATPMPNFQCGGLVTYQISIAGDEGRDNTSLLVLQPIGIFQLGRGTYLRSSALWNFNLEAETYNMPLGFGAGQAVKVDNTVFNIFLEPQFTFLHHGAGQPAMQFFAGINCQF